MRESSTKCKLFSTIGFIGRNNVFSRIPARICSGAGGIFARFGGDRRSGATLATGARKAEHMSVQERISVKGGGELDKVRGTNRIKRGERRTRRTSSHSREHRQDRCASQAKPECPKNGHIFGNTDVRKTAHVRFSDMSDFRT